MLYTQGIKDAYTYQLNAMIQKALQEQVTPGIAFMGLNLKDHKSVLAYQGSYQGIGSDLVDAQSYYDLASLTKPLVTALWAWQLIEEGKISFNQPLSDFFSFSDLSIAQASIAHLLNHSAGLPAHYSYYQGFGHIRMQGADPTNLMSQIRHMILRTTAVYQPASKSIYSDLGYMLLAWICEKVTDKTLMEYAQLTFAQLTKIPSFHWIDHLDGYCDLHFNKVHANHITEESIKSTSKYPQKQYVPTEICPWRKQTIQGTVHDDNSWLMGGVTGHAGLFGRLNDVTLWACHWINAWQNRPHHLPLSHTMVQHVCHRHYAAPHSSYTLGWDTPSVGSYSSAGRFFGENSIGHLGFTGTSMWIDLEEEIVMVLLTNRVYPQRDLHHGIRIMRPQLHNAAWQMLSS